MRTVKTVQEAAEFSVTPERKLFSATHDEILQGFTTDIYFVKTREILANVNRGKTKVVAEIFGRRDGIFAGEEEVKNLLKDFDLEVWSLPEGVPFSAKEVVMRISGPYDTFGVYETVILGILASSSGWATAAHEAKKAAGDRSVLCFGARHVHPSVAPVMERAAIIGGADGASCILGAKLAGQEPMGTVPHALFLIVGDTLEAATAYNKLMPPESPRSMLVDTFKDEVEESLRLAAADEVGLESVRLDTPSERGGVTPGLVQELRAKLDMAGYSHIPIFVSRGPDPENTPDMTMDIKEVDGKPTAKRGRIPGITHSPRLERIV